MVNARLHTDSRLVGHDEVMPLKNARLAPPRNGLRVKAHE